MVRFVAPTVALALLLAPALEAQPLPTAPPEEVGMSSERLERVGAAFQGYVDDYRIAGAVGLVARRGRLVYTEQWGMRDTESGDALEADDLFRIFSMTKPITSVAVMMLWEEGRFMLTDPVGRICPSSATSRSPTSPGRPVPKTSRPSRPAAP